MRVGLVHLLLEIVRCSDFVSLLDGGHHKFRISSVLGSELLKLGTNAYHAQTVPVRYAHPYVKLQGSICNILLYRLLPQFERAFVKIHPVTGLFDVISLVFRNLTHAWVLLHIFA